jgi:hypothetical protein
MAFWSRDMPAGQHGFRASERERNQFARGLYPRLEGNGVASQQGVSKPRAREYACPISAGRKQPSPVALDS